ncbi:TonB-dependent receptor domain-containing protein [Flavobacterium sp. HJJ]|uniref:TonB-dependent receptor domain-containing protein n=1 Tax=Flavobacterium sp. HJJ TaxID=2783792 RepID=UPI00188CD574|nr:TonB-dependent receptor [Flavobacterium sp. HJJ]MBF4471213.1 TonB-dependent receptor [Flavobacterium sp. HJJ]
MRYTVFITALLFSFVSFAQPAVNKGKIIGKVIDAETKLPIEMAIVSIYKGKEIKVFNGLSTDKNGSFSINNLPDGDYRITIDFISYKTATINSSINQKAGVLNLGTIMLSPMSNQLNEVKIVSKTSTIQSKIDKMVYSPANDLSSQGGTAADVLKNVPMVSVDIDGKIELQGNPSIRFLINGKPSSMFGASISDALQTIPADQIKSIEVITSPGVKYDAAGTGGIINIVLKENKLEGINSSINLSAGTRLENGSFNFNARHGNFGAGIFFSGNKQLTTETKSSSERISYSEARDSINRLYQNGVNPFDRSGYRTGINLSWSITPKDELVASFSYNSFSNNSTGQTQQNQTSYLADGTLVSEIKSERNSISNFEEKAIDWGLDYKKTFEKENRELDFQLTSSNGKSDINSGHRTSYEENIQPLSGLRNINPGKDHQVGLTLDFAEPISEGYTLETGVKANFQNIENNIVTDTLDSDGSYINNKGQTYAFKYKQNIYAVYASSSFAFFNDFLIGKAGLRYERTNTVADFVGVVIPDYNTFAPSFTVQHKFNKDQSIKFAYTYRIERPDYEDLNPFFNISDPHNISTGNPFLKPEIGNRYELGYSQNFSKGTNIYFSGYYRRNTDDIQSLTTFHPTLTISGTDYTDVTLTTRYNIGSEITYGASLFGSVSMGDKITIRSNIECGQRTNSTPGFESVSSFIYRGNLNLNYQFNSTMLGEISGNYRSSQKIVQGDRPASYFYNLAFRKLFFNKNASLGITMTNPFNKYLSQKSNSYDADYSQVNIKEIPVQSFGISFSYKFGKLEFKKGENENNGVQEPAY